MEKDIGKRSYVRVPVVVPVAFNVVDPSQKDELVESIDKGTGLKYEDVEAYSRLIMEKHKLQETKEVNPVLLELLVYLKRKLELLEQKLEGECKLCFEHRAFTLDLSGGGFSMHFEKELKKNVLLDTFIDVPLFPKPGIRALGKVVDCKKEADGYLVRVAFEFIREDDREDLIKFVFIKQREILARRSLGKA